MTPEELDEALRRGAWVAPQRAPALQPIGASIDSAIEDCALSLAHRHRLIDETGQLHCWACGGPCAWDVSLHCVLCKAESKRTRPERERIEREAQRAREQRERERNLPPQGQPRRAFR